MPFTFTPLAIPEVKLITPQVFGDERGFFIEAYKESDFSANGIPERFIQDNHSKSVKGVLRGLHYQLAPHAQGKLVRCLFGEIFDVAVDIRKGSPTFGQWVGDILSAENRQLLYVPPGFAHGFYTKSASAEVLYKVTCEYAPQSDRGIMWSDPQIGIEWPAEGIILSEKDKKHPPLKSADLFEY